MAEEMTTRKKHAARKTGTTGLNKLSEAAFKVVDEKAGAIATALADAVAKGNVMSVKLLIELAEKFMEAEQGEALRPFHALLLDLAAEPEWPSETATAVKRAGAGKSDA
jgi:hypothetical protein